MISPSPTSARIACVMAAKSETAKDGVPSTVRAWGWIITAPPSTARRASAAYSAGVYGIAGHCSREASAPETAQVRMTGSLRALEQLSQRAAARALVHGHRAIGVGQEVGRVAAVGRERRHADRGLQLD